MNPGISFIVRTYNSIATIEACLASIRIQDGDNQVVVVDSGSTDGTLEFVRSHADVVLQIPHERFTYGRALNIGMAAAERPVCALLSSHCILPRSDYVAVALDLHRLPKVCATNGERHSTDGRPLLSTHLESHAIGGLGFSHHSATVSRAVWERFPYDETLPASEDKEWAVRVTGAGFQIAFDPRLFVSNRHRRTQGLRALIARGIREGEAAALLRPESGLGTVRAFLRSWLREVPAARRYPYLAYVAHPKRTIELLARAAGSRRGRKLV